LDQLLEFTKIFLTLNGLRSLVLVLHHK